MEAPDWWEFYSDYAGFCILFGFLDWIIETDNLVIAALKFVLLIVFLATLALPMITILNIAWLLGVRRWH